MSRIAAPMIGGMITAPLLSLFIIARAAPPPDTALRRAYRR
jgi:Cu/Ag efflux pump CusA